MTDDTPTQNPVQLLREAIEYVFASGQPLLTSRAIRQMQEALAATEDAVWRPIDSHPRDHSWYLVTDGLNVYQVSWDPATADWWTRERGSLAVNNGIEPIYWMPIPLLPEEIDLPTPPTKKE